MEPQPRALSLEPPFFGAETLGITDFYNYVPGIIGLEISGGFTTASGGSVLFQGDTDAYQISDDITLVRGSHQFALGGQVAHWTHYTVDGQRGVGLWTFDGTFTGSGMADFLTGRLARLEHARPGVLDLTQRYSAYAAGHVARQPACHGSTAGSAGNRSSARTSRTTRLPISISTGSAGRHEHGLSQRAARISVSGDADFPSGTSG